MPWAIKSTTSLQYRGRCYSVGKVHIRSEKQLAKYKDVFDDWHMWMFTMSLRYGFTFVNDRETIFPETYYAALEKLAESSGVTIW